jgi:hypothetical protein
MNDITATCSLCGKQLHPIYRACGMVAHPRCLQAAELIRRLLASQPLGPHPLLIAESRRNKPGSL